jgi:two-component system, cell cycle response regulator
MSGFSQKPRLPEGAPGIRASQLRADSCAAPGDRVETCPEQCKIVVADDSKVYRRLVEDVLAEHGYMIYFAHDGREAVNAVADHQPSLVITDWEMPDTTGIELCRKVRDNQDSYIYIILLTSNTEKTQIVEGLAAGADDYLTKPFHPGELLARVAVGRRVTELHRQLQAKNALLEVLALTDSLTGLPNRRAIEDWTKRELSGAARYGFAFWLVMADLDHFKSVNDKYGHEAGDVVIKRFAELLRENTRASNLCGRVGGEEFVLALSHVDRAGAQTAVERIRRGFEAENLTFGGTTMTATASFGIAGFPGRGTPDLDQILRDADAALYTAKHKGRNRIEFAS